MLKAQSGKLTGERGSETAIKAFAGLGKHLLSDDGALAESISLAQVHNKWFTPENIRFALKAIAENYLDEGKLRQWISNYNCHTARQKRVALIMAGNIPLAGFHDLLCALMSGNIAVIRQSSKDKHLLPHLLEKLCEIEPSFEHAFEFTEQLKNFDAVIATGSDNSSRYFEYYFGKYPHIIRRNRNSVAVLTGDETDEQLLKLGDDVFLYFGLGCRSVSKLYVPKGYDFTKLLDTLSPFDSLMTHNGYKNNYDYNLALAILNKTTYFISDFLLLFENSALSSPIASVNFEYCDSREDAASKIASSKNELQCVVADGNFIPGAVAFGASQTPVLEDYADGVDTMQFLTEL